MGTYFFAEFQVKFMGTWVEGVIEGPGQIIYPRVRYHGSWLKGKPKGPGCFVFDTNCMQHGFYLLIKDPALEEFGEGEEEKGEKEELKEQQMEEGEEEIEIDETLGKIISTSLVPTLILGIGIGSTYLNIEQVPRRIYRLFRIVLTERQNLHGGRSSLVKYSVKI